ncbi:hypothetical protein BGW38_004257 [Lunasporangiospora selenospora]|uniref:Adhesin domain-containing protein n=1 Tax=Lunasporangiospora selenospora TaxID=979761 RepID=A0A9P6FQD0_9FUNG|nr:hypothetical protein BGW38_004257 [Lunasporangiospora selenospora]
MEPLRSQSRPEKAQGLALDLGQSGLYQDEVLRGPGSHGREQNKSLRKLRVVGRLIGLFLLSWALYQGLHGFYYSGRSQFPILQPHLHEDMAPLKPTPPVSGPLDKCLRKTTDLTNMYKFTINANNLRFHLGGKNLVSKFKVRFEWVNRPYMLISGWATPVEGEDEEKEAQNRARIRNGRGSSTNTKVQGLQGRGYEDEFEDHKVEIKVKEEGDNWESSAVYKGESDDESCASLEVELVFPALYIFNRVHLTGNVVDIQVDRLGVLELGSFHAEIERGNFQALTGLHVNDFKVHIEEGSIQVKGLAPAKAGNPIHVMASADSGDVDMIVTTTRVPESETPQRIHLASTDGNVHLKVRSHSDSGDKKRGWVAGKLEVIAESVKGIVKSKVKLLSDPQELSLVAHSQEQDVDVTVSKEYSGEFEVTANGEKEAEIQIPESDSKDRIRLDVDTPDVKKGTKLSPLVGKDRHGKIKLEADRGNARLEFA